LLLFGGSTKIHSKVEAHTADHHQNTKAGIQP